MGKLFSGLFGQASTVPSRGDELLASRYRRGVAVLLEARAMATGGSCVIFRQNDRGEPILWCRIEDSTAALMVERPDTFYAAFSKTFGEYLRENWLQYAYESAKEKYPSWDWGVDQRIESLEFQYASSDDDVIVRLEEFFQSRTPEHDFDVVKKALLETYEGRMKYDLHAWEIK